MSHIKTCVSLYSLQDEYMRKRMSFEDIFRFLSDNGVESVEFLPDQMMHGTPEPSKETVAKWKRLLETYQIMPVCIDVFLNTNLYRNRELTPRECVALLVKEIKLAHMLGVKLVRLVSMTPAFVLEPLLPFCEQYDVKVALEIHAGLSFDKKKTADYITEMKRLNSPYVGIVLDGSIFCRRIPRVVEAYGRMLGTNDEIIAFLQKTFEQGKDERSLIKNDGSYIDEFAALMKTRADRLFAEFASGYENEPYSVLDDLMPYVFHIHAKLYEMTDEDIEYSIDYRSFIQYLHDHNYDGSIATEYEGNRWTLPGKPVVEKEQTKRHQAMLKRMITEIESKGEKKNV